MALLIAGGIAALPFILNDDEDYEARLVGAILFVEGALEEGSSGSHHRLYEPTLKALKGENSWKLEARIRSTDEFNQERFGDLTATLATLCRPYSMKACWRLDDLMIDGQAAQLETAALPEPAVNDPGDGPNTAENEGALSAETGSVVSQALDELSDDSQTSAQETAVSGEAADEVAVEDADQAGEASETPGDPASGEQEALAESAGSTADQEPAQGEAAAPDNEEQSVPEIANPPSAEDRKAVTALVQKQLDRLGYVPGPADGVIGPRTETAIKAFQEDHQLPMTGEIDDRLLKALQIPQTANNN